MLRRLVGNDSRTGALKRYKWKLLSLGELGVLPAWGETLSEDSEEEGGVDGITDEGRQRGRKWGRLGCVGLQGALWAWAEHCIFILRESQGLRSGV